MAGVGKSTSGKLLSKHLGFDFVDVDELICKKSSKTPKEMIDSEGEQFFLDFEKQKMFEINLDHIVIAPGGSIIYTLDLMEYLKQHSTLVYLCDVWGNIAAREKKRGIGGKELFEERKPLYLKYADITINVQDKTPDEIVKEIINSLS